MRRAGSRHRSQLAQGLGRLAFGRGLRHLVAQVDRQRLVGRDAVAAREAGGGEPAERGGTALFVRHAARRADGEVLGYFVAMPGFEEMHLLNITVAAAHEGRGHARAMLASLYELCEPYGASALWLEVRESNARARALYLREGFDEAGRRRDYYPAPQGRREDAVLMTRLLASGDGA